DHLLTHEFFIGRQDADTINGAVIGSVASGQAIASLLDAFPLDSEGELAADKYGPQYLTQKVLTLDLAPDLAPVLAPDYFYPYGWRQRPQDAVFTENTVCIHHWAKSWTRPEVTVAVVGHREGTLAVPTLRAARAACQALNVWVELLGVVDRGDTETLRVFNELCDRVICVDNGD